MADAGTATGSFFAALHLPVLAKRQTNTTISYKTGEQISLAAVSQLWTTFVAFPNVITLGGGELQISNTGDYYSPGMLIWKLRGSL